MAAGWGTRMRPLTDTRPKPALKIAGKTLIEHNLDQLKDLVEEVVLVVGYKGEIIKKEVGEDYQGIKIRYAEQKEQLGTGDAAKAALKYLDGDFLILNGDDLYDKEDLEKCLKENPCMLAKEVKDPTGFGQIVTEDGKMVEMVEKPDKNVSNLVNIGAYFINKSFFEKEIEKSERGEYEITDYIKNYLKEEPINYVIAERWDPVSYPWNISEATENIFSEMEEEIKGKVEEGVYLEGLVQVGEKTVIKSGTRVEGPVYIGKNCVVGPNAYIRPGTCLEDGCVVGQAVEIKNSIVGAGTKIPHLSYIGDSVIGEGCNLGAGTIAANLLFSGEDIKTKVKGNIMSTGRRKLGVIMGDNVSVGVNVSFMPGVMVGMNSIIYPQSTVKKNIKKETIYKNEKTSSGN